MAIAMFQRSISAGLFGGSMCAVYQFAHYAHPPVGTYVAVLGVLAAAMTFREKPGVLEKAAWLIAFATFATLEIANLYVDRDEHDQKEHEARLAEAAAFGSIANGISETVRNEKTHFDQTIGALGVTMQASKDAALNTQPIANIRLKVISLIPQVPNVGTQLAFNIDFENAGVISANNLLEGSIVYFGPLDDTTFQAQIGKQFDQSWRSGSIRRRSVPRDLNSGESAYFTLRSDPLSTEEIYKIKSRKETVYILTRWVWSDPTGKWATDSCEAFQDLPNSIVTHRCSVHDRQRYALK